jgi:ABC-type uncharacterized transport system involved in gliding motility auxiliary subunit
VPAVRAYAQRVRELLEEFAQRSKGQLKLSVIDPQPFSEDEDRATGFGLTAVPVGANGEQLYFGLAATNSTDGRRSSDSSSPDKEEFLEYDVASPRVPASRTPRTPVVGLLSTLPVDVVFRPDVGQMREGWARIQQTRELFDVRTIAPGDGDDRQGRQRSDGRAPEEPVAGHVVRESTSSSCAAASCSRLSIPSPESDQGEGGPMGGFGADRGSDLGPLLAAWGIDYDRQKVVGDAAHAMTVSMREGDPAVPHLAVLALRDDSMAHDDVVTGGLQLVNVMSAGALAPARAVRRRSSRCSSRAISRRCSTASGS